MPEKQRTAKTQERLLSGRLFSVTVNYNWLVRVYINYDKRVLSGFDYYCANTSRALRQCHTPRIDQNSDGT